MKEEGRESDGGNCGLDEKVVFGIWSSGKG